MIKYIRIKTEDYDYIDKRERLIPEAVRMAKKRLAKNNQTMKTVEIRRGVEGSEYKHEFFSEYFHEAMELLVRHKKINGIIYNV